MYIYSGALRKLDFCTMYTVILKLTSPIARRTEPDCFPRDGCVKKHDSCVIVLTDDLGCTNLCGHAW